MRKGIFVLAILALLAGCGSFQRGGDVLLEVQFNDSRSLSILPPYDMAVVEYVVTGSGPSGSTWSDTITGNTLIGGLLPGEWTFTAVGRNAAHVALASGTGTVMVIIGTAATCHIDVNEYTTPDGSFSLDLTWEPDIVLDPIWTGSLKNKTAVVTPLVFATDEEACTSTTAVNPLAVGWYTLIVRLWDAPSGLNGSEVLSTGAAQAVRIAAGQLTHGDLALHAVQGYGSLSVDIDLNMGDPLILNPSVPFGDSITLYNGQSKAFSLTADEGCTTVYYLRGTQVGVDSYTVVAADLTPGEEYRLDAVAFNADGSRAASGTWKVTHVDLDPDLMKIAGTTNNSDQNDIRIAVLKASDLSMVASVRGSTTSFTYSFEMLPDGDYYLVEFGDGDNDGVWELSDGNPGSSGRYWPNTAGQNPGAPAAGAQIIHIKLGAPQTFNWTTNLVCW